MSKLIEYTDEEGNFVVTSDDETDRVISDPSLIGTEYLNRTVKYMTDVEQEDGSIKEEERVFALAGSYLSKEMLKEAFEMEDKFPELNQNQRYRLSVMS